MNIEDIKKYLNDSDLTKADSFYIFNSFKQNHIETIFDSCPNLHYFHLNIHLNVPFKCPDKFEKLPKLKTVEIIKEYSSINIPASLGKLENLRDLKIEQEKINLPEEVTWSKIESLYLSSLHNIENIEILENLVSLVELTIYAPITNLNFLSKLTNLKSLTLKNIKPESIDFSNCINLESLYIYNSGIGKSNASIKEIKGLENCDLKEVHLDLEGLEKTPNFKPSNNNLRSFQFYSNFTKIPTEIFNSINLQECELGRIDDDLNLIHSENIEKLSIFNCREINALSFINNFPNLTYLELQTLAEVNDLTPLTQLKKLKKIVLYDLDLYKFPTFSKTMEYVSINNCKYPEEDLEVVMKTKAKEFRIGNLNSNRHKELTKFIKGIVRSLLPLEDMMFFFEHFSPSIIDRRKKRATIEFSKSELLKINSIAYKPLFEESTQWIHEQILEDLEKNPLNNEMKVSLLGTIGTKKTDIKNRLKELGITFHPKIEEDTTHLIIGKKIKKFDGVENLTWIAENHLIDFLNEINTPYLLETDDSSSENTEHIRSLLLADDDNALLGLELLTGGGVNKDLFTEILFVHKVSENKKVKDLSKKLLLANAGPEYKKVLADRGRFMESKSEKDIVKQFRSMHEKYDDINWCLFSFYFFKKFRKGARFLFDNSTEQHHDLRKQLFDLSIESSSILNYQRIFSKDNYTPTYGISYMYQYYKARKLPLEIFDYDLHELNLRSTFTGEIPIEIARLKKLKKLDCAYNMLKELPYEISELENLEELYLEENEFRAFPMIVKKLKNLKKLSFFNNRKGFKEKNFDIPQEIKDALPNCKFITSR